MRNAIILSLLAGALPAQANSDLAQVVPSVQLVQANTLFACDLHGALRTRKGNLFYSPYSITVALGMTRQGAAGATATEMDGVLHTHKLDTGAFAAIRKAIEPRMVTNGRERRRVPTHELHVANTLWGQIGMEFEQPFLTLMAEAFDARFQLIDFTKTEAARRRINLWVEQNTKQRIKNIVPKGLPTPDCRLALGNAIYFKAAWNKPFPKRRTKRMPFTSAAGKKVEVDMMSNTDHLAYTENDDVQVVEIPYRGEDTSMVVILPKTVDGLPAFEAALTGTKLAGLLERLGGRRVDLKLPKFEITLPLRLDETLQDMGMKLAFTARANFSKMTKEESLMIGAVLHKAFVAVDEAGTEAAAATIVLMKLESRPRPTKSVAFVADHPFLFLIRHRKTGCVLFMGRLSDPESAQ